MLLKLKPSQAAPAPEQASGGAVELQTTEDAFHEQERTSPGMAVSG